jgi:hypothetical protein
LGGLEEGEEVVAHGEVDALDDAVEEGLQGDAPLAQIAGLKAAPPELGGEVGDVVEPGG